jgi:hypothetical protein
MDHRKKNKSKKDISLQQCLKLFSVPEKLSKNDMWYDLLAIFFSYPVREVLFQMSGTPTGDENTTSLEITRGKS